MVDGILIYLLPRSRNPQEGALLIHVAPPKKRIEYELFICAGRSSRFAFGEFAVETVSSDYGRLRPSLSQADGPVFRGQLAEEAVQQLAGRVGQTRSRYGSAARSILGGSVAYRGAIGVKAPLRSGLCRGEDRLNPRPCRLDTPGDKSQRSGVKSSRGRPACSNCIPQSPNKLISA